MGRKASTINLSEDERLYLETQMRARTIQAQTVIRARILLLKAEGISVDHIADKVGMNRKSVMLCINKYLEGGVENALFDAPGRGRNAEITDDEKAWIINIACQKPVNLGYSAEVWTRALLTKHINKFAEEAGHTRLSTISQSKVRTILEEADIKPNKITYYCEIVTLILTRKCIMFFLYINNCLYSLTRRDSSFRLRRMNRLYMYFPMMKNPEFRQLPIPQKTSCRMKITRRSAVIMNINVLELFHCLLESTYKQGRQFRL